MNTVLISKRGIVTIVVVLFILMSFPTVATENKVIKKSITRQRNDTLYVGGLGPNNYTKIQDAIDNANNDDTVYVFDDSSPYYERIRINKTILLKGENKNTTIIDGNLCDNAIIVLQSSDVIITGFTIRNCAENFEFSGSVYVYDDNVSIYNNIIENNGICGIYVSDGIRNTIISNNVIVNSTMGILLRYEGFNNTVINNKISSSEYGILINCLGFNISNNELLENQYGIYAASLGKTDNYICNNYLLNNTEIGIGIESSTSFCLASGNKVKNSYRGITIESGKNNTLTRNIVTNSFYGISVGSSSNLKIIENSIINSTYGVITSGSENKIFRNNFINNLRSASFRGRETQWNENYWDVPRNFPKLIFGYTGLFGLIPWIEVDWNPSNEQYDII